MPTVDLSLLPRPDVIEPLDFEVILNEMVNEYVGYYPSDQQPAVRAAVSLESDPVRKTLETAAYRELILRQRVNDAAMANMIAYATGTDLDNLGANFDLVRLVISPGDTEAIPPVPPTMESDSDFRKRVQQAFEGLSVAGPTAAYEFFARSADGKVADAKATSPAPACVTVSILSREGDGTAGSALLSTVSQALSDEDTRPVADRVTVQSAEIISYDVIATLYYYPGPEVEPIRQAALDNLDRYISTQHRIGRSVYRSAIDAALSVEGIEHVDIVQPEANIIISKTQASWCASPKITLEPVND